MLLSVADRTTVTGGTGGAVAGAGGPCTPTGVRVRPRLTRPGASAPRCARAGGRTADVVHASGAFGAMPPPCSTISLERSGVGRPGQ